jgi:hypothetical protein
MAVMVARCLPGALPMVSAQMLQQATSPTSSYATWADDFFPEPSGDVFFAELHGSDGVAASMSRPSNDPCHANRCGPNQNADALRSWSCRTLKLLMMSSAPTSTPQSPRYAWGYSVLDQLLLQPSKLLMAHSVKTEDCQLFPVLKDNRHVLLTMVNGMMMPFASLYWAHRPIHVSKTSPQEFPEIAAAMRPPASNANRLHPRSQLSSHRTPSGAWLPSTMKAARWRQQSLEIDLWCSRTRLPTGT